MATDKADKLHFPLLSHLSFTSYNICYVNYALHQFSVIYGNRDSL